MKRSILLLSTAIVAACATSPTSSRPKAGEPVEFFAETANVPAEWAARGVAGVAPTGDWLGQFNDPLMVGLVNEALANSPTLESRAAIMRASEAATRSARAARRPSLSASASAGVTSTSSTFGGSADRTTDGLYGIGLDGSWEIDLWNRLGAAVGAADAD
ncbi:MAG: TolC family protein, partial [Pseudomonadota bacterium]